MKKFISCLLVLAVFCCAVPAFAEEGKERANFKNFASETMESKANNVGDWFATIGKSDTEKKAIIAKRKADRATKRAQKEAAKKKKMMEKDAKKTSKEMKGKAKGFGQ